MTTFKQMSKNFDKHDLFKVVDIRWNEENSNHVMVDVVFQNAPKTVKTYDCYYSNLYINHDCNHVMGCTVETSAITVVFENWPDRENTVFRMLAADYKPREKQERNKPVSRHTYKTVQY